MWQVFGQGKAVEAVRLALGRGRLPHAYLIAGPRSTGKMALALDIARAVNCEGDWNNAGGPDVPVRGNPGRSYPETPQALAPRPVGSGPPCGECRSCLRVGSGKHADVQVISVSLPAKGEGEAKQRAEISIDDIREMTRQANLPPYEGRMKVFIIDGAEKMSNPAANSLLKVLEEPPPRVMMMLLSSCEQEVLPTVVSRCSRLEVRPVSPAAIKDLLLQRFSAAEERAELLSRLSAGRPGWAITALKDARILEHRRRTITRLLGLDSLSYEERFALAEEWAKRFGQSRKDVGGLLEEWLGWQRDLLLVKAGCAEAVANTDYREELERQAGDSSLAALLQALVSVQRTQELLAANASPRLAFEALLLGIQTKGPGAVAAVAPAGWR